MQYKLNVSIEGIGFVSKELPEEELERTRALEEYRQKIKSIKGIDSHIGEEERKAGIGEFEIEHMVRGGGKETAEWRSIEWKIIPKEGVAPLQVKQEVKKLFGYKY
jgi:hypothetical protein